MYFVAKLQGCANLAKRFPIHDEFISRCREQRNWRDNEWGRVLFTDESRFSLSSDSHRILIWRERGSRNHPSIIERDRYGGRSVLVWGGIMLGSRTDLHIFDAGSVNARHNRERLFRWAGVKGTHRTGRRANRPPPCSLLATVKRDIGLSVACVVCLAISPACFFWPVRQCTGHLRVWFLVDDHY
ncbi:uncharacterized protein TNCV_2131051 [Trichonephila clavipes]|nr:uncharacterized protein TNCV_2131051 [Trichonephila clavipes]